MLLVALFFRPAPAATPALALDLLVPQVIAEEGNMPNIILAVSEDAHGAGGRSVFWLSPPYRLLVCCCPASMSCGVAVHTCDLGSRPQACKQRLRRP